MTNEEAISAFKEWIERDKKIEYADRLENIEIYNLAIKALDQQPCEDCISRAEAIKEINKCHITSGVTNQGTWNECVDSIIRTIAELPPVTPQRPKGKWIKCKSRCGVEYFKCSECGKQLNWIDRDDNYCENCGSDNSESTKEFFKEWDARYAEMSGGGEE